VHATAVTASQNMSAGQFSVRTMASCYNCCTQSLPGAIVPLILVCYTYVKDKDFAILQDGVNFVTISRLLFT